MNIQALNIYWQAWGFEQAQLRKQLFIKKTCKKLEKIIKICHVCALSKMSIVFTTLEIRNKVLKSLIHKENLNDVMKDLEYFSKICLRDKLPLYEKQKAYPKFNKFLRSQSRVFQSFNKRPKFLNIDSVLRVDAILCLF